MEFLTAREAQELIVENSEFAANPDVPPAEHIREWAGVETDPIDVEQAGRNARGGRRDDAARRVGVARARRRRAPAGWTVAGIAVAVLVAGPLLALPLAFVGQGDAFDQIAASLLPRGAAGEPRAGARGRRRHAAARRRPGGARLVLRLPRPPDARVGARAAAGDAGLRARRSCCSASTTRPARCSALRDSSGCSLPDIRTTLGTIVVLTARAVPVRLRARRAARSSASRGRRSRRRARSGSRYAQRAAARRAAARPPGAGRRRRARRHGGAGRLRRGQPARLPRADRRDLPRLVRRVRPGGGAAARDRARLARARARGARAAAARPPRATARRWRAARRSCRGGCAGRSPWLAAAGAGAAARCSWSSPRSAQLVAWADRLARATARRPRRSSRAARQQPAARRRSRRSSPSSTATVVAYGAARAADAAPARASARAERARLRRSRARSSPWPCTCRWSWLDRRIDDGAGAARSTGLLLTGSAAGLVLAYVVRFHALALFVDRGAHGADRPVARRGRAQPRRRPHAAALRRPPAAAVAGDRHRRAARVRRGHEGAARDRAAAAARRRHARDRGLGGDQGLALRHRRAAGAADRRRRPRAGRAGDPALPGERALTID